MPVSRLEPHGGATLACAGIFAIVQVALNDTKQYEYALDCILDIPPIIERWTYYETRSIACASVLVIQVRERLRDSIVDLYVDIMDYLVKMAKYCERSALSKVYVPPPESPTEVLQAESRVHLHHR